MKPLQTFGARWSPLVNGPQDRFHVENWRPVDRFETVDGGPGGAVRRGPGATAQFEMGH
jgi:hypothetical protein